MAPQKHFHFTCGANPLHRYNTTYYLSNNPTPTPRFQLTHTSTANKIMTHSHFFLIGTYYLVQKWLPGTDFLKKTERRCMCSKPCLSTIKCGAYEWMTHKHNACQRWFSKAQMHLSNYSHTGRFIYSHGKKSSQSLQWQCSQQARQINIRATLLTQLGLHTSDSLTSPFTNSGTYFQPTQDPTVTTFQAINQCPSRWLNHVPPPSI